jgi:outer membrane protein OmpA-like peptidoglycan-associated protein
VVASGGDGDKGLLREADPEVHAGLGVRYRLRHSLTLRADARVSMAPSNREQGYAADWELQAGALYSFGGKAARLQPEPPSPASAPTPLPTPGEVGGRPGRVVPVSDGRAPMVAAPPAAPSPPTLPAPTAPSAGLVEPTVPAPTAPSATPAKPAVPAPSAPSAGLVEPAVPAPTAPSATPAKPALAAVALSPADLKAIARAIRFEAGSSRIDAASRAAVEKLAAGLEAAPELRVQVAGHTADHGDRDKDVRLSKKRADAVRDLLVKRGIAPDRIETAGFGPDKPLVPNVTRRGRERNERLEIRPR